MLNPALIKTEEVLIQLCFWTPLAFLIIYTCACPWWRTVFGRVVAALALVFVFALLRAELFLWHVLPVNQENKADWLSWFSVACLGLAPIAFITLAWQVVRKPVRQWYHWLFGKENPGPGPQLNGDEEQAKQRMNQFVEKLRSGKDVRPPRDVDTVDGGS